MKIVHITLEPNEYNTDACAVTVYTSLDTEQAEVFEWAKSDPTYDLPLSIDTNDTVEVARTLSPFPEYKRFQIHPTC